MKIVLCMSGGMDSTTLLFHLRAEGHEVHALGFDYGQRHKRELESAEGICEDLGVPFEVADLRAISPLMGGSALTEEAIEVPDGHYAAETMKATVVPNRNMLLLSVALSRCISLGFEGVAYAAHAGDHAIYPDCRPGFAAVMRAAAQLCHSKPLSLMTPFIDKTKADICSIGSKLGVPYEKTWSCYKGGKRHCGTCGTCVERIEAFQVAGVPDKTDYFDFHWNMNVLFG